MKTILRFCGEPISAGVAAPDMLFLTHPFLGFRLPTPKDA
ncbi:hypothetical protein Pan14r_29720 [Crateriforma conspicua]|uniref:Uncharacterized protein n=1 Tax=Crateriforma conspicua TaxID=2527996 RepID=A0A5C5Y8R3_9PLAN|nr:hypothetical protein Mal65_44400 [Crateriforma conspicua]TWT70665.1 hypothetical protein Pan14r_29720 [Crateriforma conspicua]